MLCVFEVGRVGVSPVFPRAECFTGRGISFAASLEWDTFVKPLIFSSEVDSCILSFFLRFLISCFCNEISPDTYVWMLLCGVH